MHYRSRRALLLGILASAVCQAQAFNEYQVKAAFLYSFARFVEWPSQAFARPSSDIAICVLGEDPFGTYLEDAVRNKAVNERPLALYRLSALPAGNECHILFIASSERHRLPALLASIGSRAILTVGETAEFTTQGGVIGLRLDGERIRLSVNLTTAEKARLRISSRLLSLATIVR